MLRKSIVVAMGTLLACASVLLSVPTALAASHSGDLRMKGPGGTAYTQSLAVSQVGAEGSTLTYTIQVVNTGPSVAQFLIRVDDNSAAPLQLYEGTVLVTPLASGPDGYYTKALPPGGNQVLTAKMTIPFDPTQYQYVSDVRLFGTDEVFIEFVEIIAEQTAPAATSAYDLSVKAGSQKPVGNGQNGQVATAGTISTTGTATFTATLRNGSSVPSTIYFRASTFSSCPISVTVKQGTKNVTADALAGTYHTPLLGPGQARTLKVLFKPNASSCVFTVWSARSSASAGGPEVRFSTMLINLAD